MRALRINLAILVALIGVMALTSNAFGQTNDGPKILFLHLKLQRDQTVKLVDFLIRPGELKTPLGAGGSNDLQYELLDAEGKSLWRGRIADPGERIVEQSDAGRPEKSRHHRIEIPEAEFTVRVPGYTNAVEIQFYRASRPATNRPPEKIPLGAISLPLK